MLKSTYPGERFNMAAVYFLNDRTNNTTTRSKQKTVNQDPEPDYN